VSGGERLTPARRLLRAAVCGVAALALVVPQRTFALGPFERNHPLVEKGLEAYEQGRYDEALGAFEEAKRALPNNAAVEFDRGNALVKLGRLEEAKESYHRVQELDRGELGAKDHYNLGNVWAGLGNTREAIAAYRKALTLDPRDEQARHNLEVLLRKLPPPPQSAPDAGQDGGSGRDGGSPDAGTDGGQPRQDAGTPRDAGENGRLDGGQDGGQQDGGEDGGADGGADGGNGGDGGPGDGGEDGGQRQKGEEKGDGGQPGEQEERRDGGEGDEGRDAGVQETVELGDAGEPANLNRKDTERLLDSMKQNEKNLQLWRFQQRDQQKKPRRPNDKDW
jgi:tetratricopeptide (TPR) repeat protein